MNEIPKSLHPDSQAPLYRVRRQMPNFLSSRSLPQQEPSGFAAQPQQSPNFAPPIAFDEAQDRDGGGYKPHHEPHYGHESHHKGHYKPGRVGPVYTFVKTDKYGHFKTGVRHVVGKKYAGGYH